MFDEAPARDEFADYSILTLGRIERLELCLERLTSKLLDVCQAGHVPPGELNGVLDRVRMVNSVIRGFGHCLTMREQLQTRENARAEPLRLAESKKKLNDVGDKVTDLKQEITSAKEDTVTLKKSLMNGTSHKLKH